MKSYIFPTHIITTDKPLTEEELVGCLEVLEITDQQSAVYPDSFITVTGALFTDKVVVYLYDEADNDPANNTILGQRIGSGKIDINGGLYVGQYLYLIRYAWDETTSTWVIVMSTRSQKKLIKLGDNGSATLYAGDEIQTSSDILDKVAQIIANQTIINQGVQKSSLMIPHSTNL